MRNLFCLAVACFAVSCKPLVSDANAQTTCPNIPSGYQLNAGTVVDYGGGTGKALMCSTDGKTFAYYAGGQPTALFDTGLVTLSAALKLGGYALPGTNSVGISRAFTFTAIAGAVTANSGGGAANSVITLTDGTNTCTATIPCNVNSPGGSQNNGGLRLATANGSGLGCAFPAGADITASVTTAGCTTTQPSVNLAFEGQWQ
jgi:hypothetical protein